MKNLFLFIALVTLVSSAHAEMPKSRDDLNLKITLENQINTKLEKNFPETRFVVMVNMAEPSKIHLDLIGTNASVTNQDKAIIDQVQNVTVFAEDTFTPEKISQVTEIPVQKITIKQLEPYAKKVPAEVVQAKAKTFGETLHDAMANYYQSLVVLGILFALTAAFFLVNGIYRMTSGIQTAAKDFFQGAGNRTASEEARPAQTQNQTQTPAHQRFNSETKWTPVQLKAMFSECYWTGQDSVAANLVRNYPSPAYQEFRFGSDYLNYLLQVNPGSAEGLEDAYFTNPNPVFFEMSTEDTPATLVRQCSKFRFEQLSFTASEMIRAQNQDVKGLQTAVMSTLRVLPTVYRVKFKDVEEETSVINSGEFNEAVKLALPSLYTLSRLTQTEFDTVIQNISVQELAEAWVGPTEILSEIESRLPARKREVFHNVKQTVKASRDSLGFHKIMTACAGVRRHSVVSEDESGAKAA